MGERDFDPSTKRKAVRIQVGGVVPSDQPREIISGQEVEQQADGSVIVTTTYGGPNPRVSVTRIPPHGPTEILGNPGEMI